jgi:hypothetical protein
MDWPICVERIHSYCNERDTQPIWDSIPPTKMSIICFFFFSSILQRELYNILVNEDAQQVLLTPDPSQYK